MSDSLIGKQLGDYQIRELLGRGGMARVYIGYDARLDRQAAVKIINNDFNPADRAEYTERFRREARAIARLNHPNIVGVYQFGQYEDSYYMAMAFVEGRDLRQVLREYSDRHEIMPLSDVLNIVRGIGSALDYAHGLGVIHRDVKPSNIMVNKENRPILTDFGLALSANEGTLGETFGSAHYIAPEQAVSSAKAVSQSDLYSLGVCMYEMLTGKVPFDDPSAMSVALKHLQDLPPPPSLYNVNLSVAIEQVVLRVLDKDPAHRPATGAELTRSFENAINNGLLADTSEVMVADIRNAQAQRPTPVPTPAVNISSVPMITPRAPAQTFDKPEMSAVKQQSPPTVPNETADIVTYVPVPIQGVLTPLAPARQRRISFLPLLVILLLLGSGGALFAARTPGLLGTPTPTLTITALEVTLSAVQIAALPLATATPTATDTATNIPATATPTITSTLTASAAQTVTAAQAATIDSSVTASDATTAPATVPATLVPATVVPSATLTATIARVDVVLIYDKSQINLINKTSHLISIKAMKFVQNGGTPRVFTGIQWVPNNNALPPQDCFQARLYTLDSMPIPKECASLFATYGAVRAQQFWIAQSADVTTFDVSLNDALLATCPITTGRCEFALPG